VKGIDAGTIRTRLAQRRINVSVAPAPFTPSGPVLTGVQRGPESVVRASVHYYNTETEIQRLVGFIRQT
jgi:cysteine desulfurase/selenocysteine lyase